MLKSYPPTTTTENLPYWNVPHPSTRGLHKCTCKRNNTSPSSSCSSLSSEYAKQTEYNSLQNETHAKAQYLQRAPVKRVNISHDELSRPQLIPGEMPKSFFTNQSKKGEMESRQYFETFSTSCDQPTKPALNLNKFAISGDEQFYSCSSEGSESDEKSENLFGSQSGCSTGKKDTILQLLHEVENLISTGNPAPSNSAGRLSKEANPESQMELRINHKVSKPTSTTQLESLLWPPPPWFCNCPHNVSFFPPFHLATPAFNPTEIPAPFVYEDSNSFKSAAIDSKSVLTADQLLDNLSCACFAAQDPLDCNIIRTCSSVRAAQNNQNDVSIQTNFSSCCNKEMDAAIDAFNNQIFSEDIVSFKDCSSGNNSVLTADRVVTHSTCKYVCKQILLEYKNEMLTLSCLPVVGSKSILLADDPLKDNSLESQVKLDFCQGSLETEDYLDEELHPRYVDDVFTEPLMLPFEVYHPCSDCLMEYDDEEPNFNDEIGIESALDDLTNTSKPTELAPMKLAAELEHPKENVDKENLNESAEPVEIQQPTESQHTTNDELDALSYNKDDDEAENSTNTSEESDASRSKNSQETYKFLPEMDKPRDSKQLILYENNSEEDQELAKEKMIEDHKQEKPDGNDQIHGNGLSSASPKQQETKGCAAEMKFFIDSLILDLEAMDFARRKSQFEENILKPEKLAHYSYVCDSFPATITGVTDLGANSLYVKWKTHDCFGVGGYEIYTDGYLTNRFYNSRHNAAVVTQVDITLPHKIALVAQPVPSDNSSDFISCTASRKTDTRLKSLAWSTAAERQRQARAPLWMPSIFLYDPSSARASLSHANTWEK